MLLLVLPVVAMLLVIAMAMHRSRRAGSTHLTVHVADRRHWPTPARGGGSGTVSRAHPRVGDRAPGLRAPQQVGPRFLAARPGDGGVGGAGTAMSCVPDKH
jgi:hypothetical protein